KEIKKTKEFNKFLVNNKLSNALIVSDKESEKNFIRSARNIKDLKVISDEGANIYDMLKYKNIIITSSSIKKIENRILNEKN
ncbi:MAG: 50S ribosomal protein L4, partial [Pelagibacteraceae bacterium]